MRLAISLLVVSCVVFFSGCSDGTAEEGRPIEPLLRSTVLVAKNNGHGSGMIIGPDIVLTAYHVVRGRGSPDIRFLNGEANGGKVIWSDPLKDLALVKVDVPEDYPVVSIDCKKPVSGDYVITVGHPLRSEWIASGGHLPKTDSNRNGQISLGFSVGQGASGGPVFNNQGHVVGITLTILTRRLLARRGIGYMLPASDFCDTVREKTDVIQDSTS